MRLGEALLLVGATALFFLGAFWAAYREVRRVKADIRGYKDQIYKWHREREALIYDRERLEKVVVAFRARSHKKKGSRYNP